MNENAISPAEKIFNALTACDAHFKNDPLVLSLTKALRIAIKERLHTEAVEMSDDSSGGKDPEKEVLTAEGIFFECTGCTPGDTPFDKALLLLAKNKTQKSAISMKSLAHQTGIDITTIAYPDAGEPLRPFLNFIEKTGKWRLVKGRSTPGTAYYYLKRLD